MKSNYCQWKSGMVVYITAIVILFGCAARKPIWGDPDSGLILSYRAAEGKTFQYQSISTAAQKLNLTGQLIETGTKTELDFTAVPKAHDSANLLIGVTVDKLIINIVGPGGPMSPYTDSIVGKSFDFVLSPLGKELDLKGAKALTYQTAPGVTTSIKSLFHMSFPDLPESPVKIGDTWPSVDDVVMESSTTKIHLALNIVNTLAGLETVDGLECAKITRKLSGIIDGDAIDASLGTLTFEGKSIGTSTWYFAYKEGLLAKASTKIKNDIDVSSSMGPMQVELEVTEDIKLQD